MTGYANGKLVGSGVVLWDSRKALAEGLITEEEMLRDVSLSAPRSSQTLLKRTTADGQSWTL